METTVSEAPSTYRDARPTYKLNEQEASWTAHKFMGLMVVTLAGTLLALRSLRRETFGS